MHSLVWSTTFIHRQRLWNQKIHACSLNCIEQHFQPRLTFIGNASSCRRVLCRSGSAWDRPTVAMVGCGRAGMRATWRLIAETRRTCPSSIRPWPPFTVGARPVHGSLNSIVRPTDAMPYSSSNQSVIDPSAIAALRPSAAAAACPKLDPYTTSSASSIQHNVIDFWYFDNVRLMLQECHDAEHLRLCSLTYGIIRACAALLLA